MAPDQPAVAIPSIFLIGSRGSGKTSVGRALAARLGRPFHDTDEAIEARAGKSIASIFSGEGEPAFREMECAALESVIGRIGSGEALVVATGGGIVLDPANTEAMRRAGRVVWLVVDAATLERRIAADPRTAGSRPGLLGGSPAAEAARVLAVREPLYRAAAHIELRAGDLPPGAAAERIVEAMSKP